MGHGTKTVSSQVHNTFTKKLLLSGYVALDAKHSPAVIVFLESFPMLPSLRGTMIPGAVDIHGLGDFTDGNYKYNGAYHGVNNSETAAMYYKHCGGVLPNKRLVDVHPPLRTTMEIPSVNGESVVKLRAEIIEVKHDPTIFNPIRASTAVTIHDLLPCLTLTEEDASPDTDVTFVWGFPIVTKDGVQRAANKSYGFVLRLHNIPGLMNLNQENINKLLTDLRATCNIGKGGFEAFRKGGSSGPTTIDKIFMKFLKVPGAFPRLGKGIKFIQHKNHWEALYISSKVGRQVVQFDKYTTPQVGGSLNLNSKLLSEFPYLLDFAESKYTTTLITQHLNEHLLSHCPIQPEAVEYELSILDHARRLAKGARHLYPNINLVGRFLSALNKYTIVCYPVCYHVDVFDGHGPSLENKKTFIHSDFTGVGRGGANGRYVWAIIDWRNEQAGRRRLVYLAMPNADPNQRITDAFWANYLAQNNLPAADFTFED